MESDGLYGCTPGMTGIPRVVKVTSQSHWCRKVRNGDEKGV